MQNRAAGLVLIGFFVVLFLAMHVVAIQTFGSVFSNDDFLFRASPFLSLVTFGFGAAGVYFFLVPDAKK